MILASGAGVISDISEPFERGGFFGVYGLGPMVRHLGLEPQTGILILHRLALR